MPDLRWETLQERLEPLLQRPNTDDSALAVALHGEHPADVASVMEQLAAGDALRLFLALDNARAAEVLDDLAPELSRFISSSVPTERIAELLDRLPMDEAAEVVAEAAPEQVEAMLSGLAARAPVDAAEVRQLLTYGERTAGRLLTDRFVRLSPELTVDEAFALVRHADPEVETLTDLYVVRREATERGDAERLIGVLSLRDLVRAKGDQAIGEVMTTSPVTVHVDTDQEDVARLIAKYDFLAMPVLDRDGYLAGIITVDDVIDILVEEFEEDVAKMVGTDADELDRRTPAQIAKLRLPWIMATMFIELLAGFVIHFFDQTLTKYILLASFMPIISAISGNTGLQSAAIIIRGLSTGHVQLAHWKPVVQRQLATTALLGGACALVLGIIAAAWDRQVVFGLTVFLGMFLAVNIAGVVGTIVPMLSKRAGYDPALTAGPFETAFQDVIGISIFLTLASLMLRWMH